MFGTIKISVKKYLVRCFLTDLKCKDYDDMFEDIFGCLNTTPFSKAS